MPGSNRICAPGNSARRPSSTVTVWVGIAVVVAQQDPALVRQGADHRDLEPGSLQRQNPVVLQQHHGFVGQLTRQGAMLRAVQQFLVDLRIWHQTRADRTCPA